jgi:hypothetical protein
MYNVAHSPKACGVHPLSDEQQELRDYEAKTKPRGGHRSDNKLLQRLSTIRKKKRHSVRRKGSTGRNGGNEPALY